MNLKNWLVPGFSFFLFLYFLIFVGFYTVKITGENVRLHDSSENIILPKTETERMLNEISKSISKQK